MKITQENEPSRLRIVSFIIIVLLIIATVGAIGSSTQHTNKTQDGNTSKQKEPRSSARIPNGEQTSLNTGMYTSPSDLKPGTYDVTAPTNESGNFIVSGSNSYNEVFGGNLGVAKLRVVISAGSTIEISGVSSLSFTPVSSDFVRDHVDITLFSGTFVVGEDIGPGRYTITPGSGESGNLIIKGSHGTNEILGGDYGVPEYTVTLNEGDIIDMTSMNTVTFTAK